MTYQRFETTRDKASWYKSKATSGWNEAEASHRAALRYALVLAQIAYGKPQLTAEAARRLAQRALRAAPKPLSGFNKPTF
jgi:hypothetical protein